MAAIASNFIQKLLSWKKKDFQQSVETESRSGDYASRWEEYAMCLYKILLWEDAVLSSVCVVVLNIVFWLLVQLDYKLYGFVFSAILTVFLYEVWNEYVWPEVEASVPPAHPASQIRALRVGEMRQYLERVQQASRQACNKMKRLREEQPGTFCLVCCVCFLCLSVIGRSISGLMLLYTMLMLVMTLPGFCVHFVSKETVSSALDSFMCSSQREVEEYLPESSKETMELLNIAGDLLPSKYKDEDEDDLLLEQITARTNDTAGSSCSKLSFSPEGLHMPSHENSLDFLEAEFELPQQQHSPHKSDSEESDPSDIQFQNKHFNGDSTDEEEEFSRGLKFKEPKTQLDEVTANMGRRLLSMGVNIISAATTQQQQHDNRESSSDTDSFEMISEDDV